MLNVGVLPWEAVVEFREHGGSVEARAMLREFEEKAAREEPEDAAAFLRGVSQDVTAAMATAAAAQRQRWPIRAAATGLGTVVGFEPHIGPFAGSALTAAVWGWETIRERKSWTAALMRLVERS